MDPCTPERVGEFGPIRERIFRENSKFEIFSFHNISSIASQTNFQLPNSYIHPGFNRIALWYRGIRRPEQSHSHFR